MCKINASFTLSHAFIYIECEVATIIVYVFKLLLFGTHSKNWLNYTESSFIAKSIYLGMKIHLLVSTSVLTWVYMLTQYAALKTYLNQWMIGTNGKKSVR